MSRHVPDDFSFLPTVDSTDEEAVEKELLWKPKGGQPPPETEAPEQEPVAEHFPPEEPAYEEPVYEEPVYEEQAHDEAAHEEPIHEEPVYEETFHEEVIPEPPAPPVFVQEPPPARKMRVFEPDDAHSAPAPAVSAKKPEPPAPPEKKAPVAEIRPPKPLSELPNLAGLATTPVHPGPKAAVTSTPVSASAVTILAKPPPVPLEKAQPRSAEAAADEAKKESAEDELIADVKPFTAPKPPPEEPLDPDEAKKQRWKKLADKVGLRTLGMSVGVHLFLLLIAAFITLTQVMDPQVDFLPGGSSPQAQAAAEALTHKVQTKKNPWLKAKPQQRKITVQSLASTITLPEMPPMDSMDFSQINSRMDLSKAPSMGAGQPLGMGGSGGGMGAGLGRGGKFSFVGQTATGRRVVFVVDVSGSMSNRLQGGEMSRFDLLKKELSKAIKQMPMGTAYQVLFFSDFAWPHNEVDSRNSSAMEKYRWEIKPEDYKKVKIPSFKYIVANPFALQDSEKIIQGADNPGGTNWGSGLLMALNANPKPDVIFFMTDGERQDEMGWIDIVTAENKRKLPMTAIYTSVMAQIDAAREMDTLAKRNNGKFTVIMGDGKVIKGEDFFK